jgi:hypothetical protein
MAPALILCAIGAPSFALLQGVGELNQLEVTLKVIEGETALEGGETTPTAPASWAECYRRFIRRVVRGDSPAAGGGAGRGFYGRSLPGFKGPSALETLSLAAAKETVVRAEDHLWWANENYGNSC